MVKVDILVDEQLLVPTANLVNSGFTHMGVGVATDRSGTVWVAEVFARL